MPKATDEVIAEAKAKHPGVELEVIAHPTYADECIARGPIWNEYQEFAKKLAVPGEALNAWNYLIDTCVVWPAKEDRRALFDRRPAMLEVWGIEIREMAGATVKATRRKL